MLYSGIALGNLVHMNPRTILRVIGVVGLIVPIAYSWALVRVYAFSRTDELELGLRADGIVVLGAAQWHGVPSPVLRGRLDHAFKRHPFHGMAIPFERGSRVFGLRVGV